MFPNNTRTDRYTIEKAISHSGGMSSVYLARINESQSLIAIKFALAETSIQHTSNEDVLLQWEADLLSRWDWRHPGIIRIFPIPLKDRNPVYTARAMSLPNKPWYMIMEYLGGGSLDENLHLIQKYPLQWKLELFYQLLLPIAFIHKNGYAHRDIKPGNIVFRNAVSFNKVPEPVLVDFALATNGNEQRTIIDNSYTLEYASPERILRAMPMMGEEINEPENVQASDIWSLGVVLYEILTGKLLFKGNRDTVRTTIIREQMKPDLPISDERGRILAEFIRSMLNKNPERRPTVKQVIYALEEKFLPPRIEVGNAFYSSKPTEGFIDMDKAIDLYIEQQKELKKKENINDG